MKTILVVNPNDQERTIVSSMLIKSGYSVIAESDGGSALSLLERTDVNLVITEFSLPDMNIITFFGALKKIRSAPPVLIVSDRVDVKDYLIAVSLGAFEFLFKPVNRRELMRVIQIAIGMAAAVNPEREEREPADRQAVERGSWAPAL